MSNKWKRLLAVLLATTICMTLFAGCSSEKVSEEEEIIEVTPMEPEESRAIGISELGGKDVMPISGSQFMNVTTLSKSGVSFPDMITDENIQLYKELGLTSCGYSNIDYDTNPDLVMKSLDLAEKYGMTYAVTDSFIDSMIKNGNIDKDALAERLANYIDHPACQGIHLVDEPNTAYYMPAKGDVFISKYADIAKALNELNVTTLNCLLPCYTHDVEGMQDKYKQYVTEYCDTFEPKHIYYDNYPFKNNGMNLENYFWNMSVIREIAEKYNISYGVCLQAGGQWNDANVDFDSIEYYPNEGQFNWNASMSLAMGAQFISYFPARQPVHYAKAVTNVWDFERNGLVGAAGNKTQWYYYAKNLAGHIKVIDEVLMNSVNKGVIITSEQAKKDLKLVSCVIDSGKFQELMSVKGDALVGCFNYQGKTALYVTNYSMEYAQKITLTFNKAHNIKMVQGTETSYVNAKNLKLDMAAGEGVLLVIE